MWEGKGEYGSWISIVGRVGEVGNAGREGIVTVEWQATVGREVTGEE